MERSNVKITVVKKLKPGELFDQYAGPGVDAVCPRVKIGDVYVVENLNMPEGFCSWAWADIQRDVVHLSLGGNFPWIKEKGVMLSCCTDGLRPVIFKLERM